MALLRPTTVAAGNPRDLAALDADGDGDLDAATANAGSGDVSIWPNTGGAALGTPSAIALTAGDFGAEAIAAGDLDNDGVCDDLAVACADSHTVALISNAGTATPTVTSMSLPGLRPVDVLVCDLDADPRDDVVVALEGTPFGGGEGLALSLNGGAFATVSMAGAVARKAVRLAHGDLDGDGDQDLAVLAQGGTDQLLVFLGAGNGSLTLTAAWALPTSGLSRGLACGDLDSDGDLDLAVVLPTLFPTAATSLRLYTYTPNGTLNPADYAETDLVVPGVLGSDVAMGDVDDDGLGDLAVVQLGSGQVVVLQGWNGSSFASTTTPAVGDGPVAVAIGDLDNNGGDDVVVANQASDDVTVLTFAQQALVQAYGAGCAGTGGLVPLLTGIGQLTQPSTTFGVQLSNARALSPALMLFALEPASSPFGACTLLVTLPASSSMRFTNGLGTDTYVFGVPASPVLVGFDLYFQYAVLDPLGTYGPGVAAFSNGLRAQVGI